MSSGLPAEDALLPRSGRILLAVCGSVLLGLLVVASQLSPSPRGTGTHQQLGLPPCSFLASFGIRCPACGMTTSWAHFTHGQVLAACRASCSGTVLAVLALLLGTWTLVSGIRGRFWLGHPSEVQLAIGSIAVTVLILLEWGLRVS